MKHLAPMATLLLMSAVALAQRNPFGHALVPDMIADASITLVGDTFYCYATTDGYGRGLETSGPPVVWKSTDFLNWSFEGTYFPSAEQEKYWAPSKAVQRGNKWYIIPTVNHFMHVAVADSPNGPFRLIRGEDRFTKPYTEASTLLQEGDREGIDAEIFIDDDGQAYVFWGKRRVAKLDEQMRIQGEIKTLETRRKEYSEGPIFFKRKGIYYYLYTIGGDEHYEYYYQMSRTSPMGPYETPTIDRVSTTSVPQGVFGPGHGCVFNDGDDYYFAFLEFSRNSTNRQTYVNRLEFNDDGTIRPVAVTLDGVGALRPVKHFIPAKPANVRASSTREPQKIRYFKDNRCQRTEYFSPDFAFDGANGSRWMAANNDKEPTLTVDLGGLVNIRESELCFVRPTAGHAYRLEGSSDGKLWKPCGGHTDIQKRSPHTDAINQRFRYLRITITEGVPGVWEWKIDAASQQQWGQWTTWGEQPDGTYRNPIIPADYSDLDCIRVGNDYYAISSTMQFSPGMTVLHSRDLVNWEIAGNAVSDLTQISPALSWEKMDRYGRGIWAGTLRHHNGRFYLFFGTPNEGLFMTSAPSAAGPWEPLTTLLAEEGWDDCTAIWEDNGKAWFLATCFAQGYKTYLFPMAPDARSIDRSKARFIHEGYGREASKLIHHDGYYYLVFSEHRDGIGRYVLAKRDKKMTGSFSEERQLLQACREANEPNQGGIIQGPDNNWYFLTHHGSGDWSGRIMSLLPVTWKDGWPLMGDIRDTIPGVMTWQAAMPKNEKWGVRSEGTPGTSRIENETCRLQRSDDFDYAASHQSSVINQLSPQWQWNYQPRADKFSLTERPGWLRLYAFRPLEKDRLLKAGNTLTQRSFRSTSNDVIVKLDISHLADGQHAGLCHFAEHSGALGVVRENNTTYLEQRHDDRTMRGIALKTDYLWLRSTWGLDGQSAFFYSLDGDHFTPLGEYSLSWGFYRGDRIGIYNYNDVSDDGFIDVDYLHYDCP